MPKPTKKPSILQKLPRQIGGAMKRVDKAMNDRMPKSFQDMHKRIDSKKKGGKK